MEVHHHPDLQHKKKNFKEYFLEFLMIFLAVTLGFFAEQVRENFADHEREKEYMKSMVEDLKSDTALLSLNIHARNLRNEMVDSLIYLLSASDLHKNGNDIYYLARVLSPPLNIFPNDRTIQQLKGSGSLRLIRNMPVSNSIMAYDQKMRQLLFELTDEIQIRAEYRQLADKIFNGNIFNKMINANGIIKPVDNPQLFNTDAATINAFTVEVQYLKNANRAEENREKELMYRLNN